MLARDEVRLVTLTGPGGVGKTRVAIEATRTLADRYPRGVLFVDLAPERDPKMVLVAIAARLGVVDFGQAKMQVVLPAALAGKRILLVLDNVEQVVDSASDLAWLLSACPGLTILATSRKVLRIAAEHVLDIQPFENPGSLDFDRLQQVEAVQLFVARARAANSSFEFTPESAPHVVNIVTRLQGMPLAIELAAARTRLWSVFELESRLENQLPVLSGGMRDAPARQRTMADTVEWSYSLLTAPDQTVLRAMSIFPVGCTLDTIAAVMRVELHLTEWDVTDAVEQLVDSSLVRARDGSDGRVRYRMLLPVREYCLRLLAELDEESTVRSSAHGAWCQPTAARAELIDFKPDPIEDIRLVAAEMQNLREHVTWLIDQDRLTDALEIEGYLAFYRAQRGYLGEVRPQLEMLLADPRNQNASRVRASAVTGLGMLCFGFDDANAALEAFAEAIAIARPLAAYDLVYTSLIMSSHIQLRQAHSEDAIRLLAEAREVRVALEAHHQEAFELVAAAISADRSGDNAAAFDLFKQALESAIKYRMPWYEAVARLCLAAHLLEQEKPGESEAMIHQAQAIIESLGNLRDMTDVYFRLSDIERARNDNAQLARYIDKAQDLSQQTGNLTGVASCYMNHAWASIRNGDYLSALTSAVDGITLFDRCGFRLLACTLLDTLADIAIGLSEGERSAWCIGAVDGVRTNHNLLRSVSCQADHDVRRKHSRLLLDDESWRIQYERGRSMNVDEIMAEAESMGRARAASPHL